MRDSLLLRYWVRALKKGLSESMRLANWKSGAASAAYFILGSAVHWHRFGQAEAMNELAIWLSYTFAPIGAVALVVIFYNVFRAPALIDRETRDDRDRFASQIEEIVGVIDTPIELIHEDGGAFSEEDRFLIFETGRLNKIFHIGIKNNDPLHSLRDVRVMIDYVDTERCDIPLHLPDGSKRNEIRPEEVASVTIANIELNNQEGPRRLDRNREFEVFERENGEIYGYRQDGREFDVAEFDTHWVLGGKFFDYRNSISIEPHQIRISVFARNTPKAEWWFVLLVDRQGVPSITQITDEAEIAIQKEALV